MDIRRVGNTGIHTVEGNVAGGRAASLTKQAAIQREEYELTKHRIKEENSSSIRRIHDKFTTGSDNIDQEFRDRTIGKPGR
jgi:protein FAM50